MDNQDDVGIKQEGLLKLVDLKEQFEESKADVKSDQ